VESLKQMELAKGALLGILLAVSMILSACAPAATPAPAQQEPTKAPAAAEPTKAPVAEAKKVIGLVVRTRHLFFRSAPALYCWRVRYSSLQLPS